MAVFKFRQFDETKLNDLIDKFETCGSRSRDFAQVMRKWKSNGDVTSKEKDRLVDWCKDSPDTRTCARNIAKEISELVFGKVVDGYD
jgi:hypothetical protein